MTLRMRHLLIWLGTIVLVALHFGFAAAQQDADVLDIGPPVLADTNPAVRAALQLPRTTPAEHFQAISWLIDLGRPDLAAPMLDALRNLPLGDEARAALVHEFGSHRMLRLARTAELAPAGGEFAEACLEAAATLARDPERLAALVDRLADPSPEVRQAARVDLAAAGQDGVNATLEALARATDAQRRAALARAAARMEPLVVGPLLAMLDTEDRALRLTVAHLLEHLGVTPAAPLLASPVNAERALADAVSHYRRGTPAFVADENGEVELWQWDDAAKSLSAKRLPYDEAQTMWIARLADELARLRPDDRSYQRVALVYGLESGGSPAGGDLALVNDALSDALAQNFNRAAAALADELGQRGEAGILFTVDGRPAPLARALAHSDRRVRFAALRAIMQLDPPGTFPGASRVPEALVYFATGAGERRAIVAMPMAERATHLAGQLAAHGLAADAANRGADAVHLARQMGDVELVLIDMDILVPDVREVVFQLRSSPTAGDVPIGLLAADGRLEAAQRLAGEHRRVVALPRPHSAETVARAIELLHAAAGRDFVPAEERARQAEQAIAWLAELAEREASPFRYALQRESSVIEAALYGPATRDSAIAALTTLGTPASQRALLNFAGQSSLPIESRRQAAAAFQASVAARGVLLTSDEILTQYHRYNASAHADADTQQVLGALLDAIESRRDAPPAP